MTAGLANGYKILMIKCLRKYCAEFAYELGWPPKSLADKIIESGLLIPADF
jgi:hypothetical protein